MLRRVVANFVVVVWSCALISTASAAPVFTLTPIIRDFHYTQTDFEILNWSTLTPTAYFANNQSNKIEKGIAGPIGAALGPDGVPVYSPTRDPGFYNTVSSASSFAMWFADTPGNMRVSGVTIPFTANADGTYSYNNPAFFPIDNQGFGTEGFDHNYHFTAQFHATFTYAPGQNFSIVSDDDSWVFINHKLAIDAGGIHGTLGGSVDLSTLSLTAGDVYDLDVFYVERNRFGAALEMNTSILLPEPSMAVLLACAASFMLTRFPRKYRTV